MTLACCPAASYWYCVGWVAASVVAIGTRRVLVHYLAMLLVALGIGAYQTLMVTPTIAWPREIGILAFLISGVVGCLVALKWRILRRLCAITKKP